MIDIQPVGEPSVVVSVSHVQADPALTVGSTVDREHLEDRHAWSTSPASSGWRSPATRRTPGNHVELTLHPAATVPLR